jgi:hypothetical protein
MARETANLTGVSVWSSSFMVLRRDRAATRSPSHPWIDVECFVLSEDVTDCRGAMPPPGG